MDAHLLWGVRLARDGVRGDAAGNAQASCRALRRRGAVEFILRRVRENLAQPLNCQGFLDLILRQHGGFDQELAQIATAEGAPLLQGEGVAKLLRRKEPAFEKNIAEGPVTPRQGAG